MVASEGLIFILSVEYYCAIQYMRTILPNKCEAHLGLPQSTCIWICINNNITVWIKKNLLNLQNTYFFVFVTESYTVTVYAIHCVHVCKIYHFYTVTIDLNMYSVPVLAM